MAHWAATVDLSDVWSDETIPFQDKRDRIVKTLKDSTWRTFTPYPATWDDHIGALEQADTVGEFDAWFDALYDVADLDRVWIKTF